MTMQAPGELEEYIERNLEGGIKGPGPDDKDIQGRSLGQIAWRRLRRDKVAMAGGVFIIFLTLVAIFAKQIVNWYGQFPNTIHNSPPGSLVDPSTQMPIGSFGGANGDHWLGVTPALGQDVFAQLIY